MAAIQAGNKSSLILKYCLVFLLPLICPASSLEAGDFSLSGYFKSYLFLFDPAPSGQDQPLLGLSSNRFRLHLAYQPKSWMSLDAAYDLVPKIQKRALSQNPLLFGQIDPFAYRVADLRTNLYPTETDAAGNFVLSQNLDRASVVFHAPSADITIGRQPIAWGSARTVNPTDVLAPFTFEALDTEDRIGIDAVRARIPLGTLSELDAGYIFGKDFKFENSAFYARTKFNLNKADVSFLLLGFRENLLAGFDLARSIGGAGFWLETAYVFVNAMNGDNSRGENYYRASLGIDYSFSHKTYGFVEYHFNGAGASAPGEYLNNFAQPAYTEGSVYLMGRHYIVPGISCQLHPLIALVGQSMINIADPSVYLTPQLDYNVASNVYLGAGAFIGIGERPSGGGGPQTLRSEFGGYPNFYFGSFRYYF